MTLELLTEILNTADTEINVNGNYEHAEKLCREVLSAIEQDCSVPSEMELRAPKKKTNPNSIQKNHARRG